MISVRQGQSGDRIIRRADHADQVSGDGGEEEADDDHDDGRHDAALQHSGVAGVQRDHADEHDAPGRRRRSWH